MSLYQSLQYKDKYIYIRNSIQPFNGKLPYGILPSYYKIDKVYPFNIVTLNKEELKGLYFKLNKDDWFDSPMEGSELSPRQREFFHGAPIIFNRLYQSEKLRFYVYLAKKWLFVRLFNPTQRRLSIFIFNNVPKL